jgi:phenylalanyl-tRNA synthetase beta chain
MKLHLSVLEKFIDLPTKVPSELRPILDESGLEVKNIEEDPHPIFTIETLANRGDHACALGVARELSARLLIAIKHPELSPALPEKKASVQVHRETELCMRYGLLELSLPRNDVKGGALRPEIKAVCGENTDRAPIVHVLNYVLLELGQPMHAFDREKVEGAIRIVTSTEEETIKALDGNEYKVPAGSILIKDSKKTIAVAGVIGCENSMVTLETRAALIESAIFDPVTVRKTARAMGISTDASFIFERGADHENVVTGLRRAVVLASTPGNAADPLGFTLSEGVVPSKRMIVVSLDKARAEMGLPRLPEAEIITRLRNLGFKIVLKEKNIECEVPSWRLWDVSNPADIIEEIVRVVGLSRVTLKLPALDPHPPKLSEYEQLRAAVEPVLISSGFFEVISKAYYSKSEVETVASLDRKLAATHVEIINAIESGNSHLKVTNIPHLVRICDQNIKRGQSSVKVFELARCFGIGLGGETEVYPHEKEYLTLAMTGRWSEGEWRKGESQEVLVSMFKGVLGSIAASVGRKLEATKTHKNHLLHPGIQATIKIGGHNVGSFGLVHPVITAKLGVKADVLFAELEADKLIDLMRERVRNVVSVYPSVWRDFTVKVPTKEFASKVISTVNETKNSLIADCYLVDDFKREGEEFRRLSFRVVFQSVERTLEGKEIEAGCKEILSHLENGGFSLVS